MNEFKLVIAFLLEVSSHVLVRDYFDLRWFALALCRFLWTNQVKSTILQHILLAKVDLVNAFPLNALPLKLISALCTTRIALLLTRTQSKSKGNSLVGCEQERNASRFQKEKWTFCSKLGHNIFLCSSRQWFFILTYFAD